MLIGNVWCCMKFLGTVLYCLILSAIAWCCPILFGIAELGTVWYSLVLTRIAWYYLVVGTVWYCLVLSDVA